LVTEIDEAHEALGALIERTLPLASENLAPPSWEVARAAAETLPAIEAGTTVAVAVAGGAIATVVATAALGAVTGGAGALAGVLIIGGVRRWRRKRAAHRFDADLDQYQEELATNLLPAVQAAVLYHLDVIATLIEYPDRDSDVLTWIDLKDHLDETFEIARRFATGSQHLRAQAKQARLRGKFGPAQFLEVLGDVYITVIAAQRALAGQPPVDWSPLDELVAERGRLGAIRLISA
jgi:antitoxin (DNA-binding transcriptional repressor) of toxin-antitoxin stability system